MEDVTNNIDKDIEILRREQKEIIEVRDMFDKEHRIYKECEESIQALENVLSELETKIGQTHLLSEEVFCLNKELETYKKIAEKLLDVTDEEKTEAYFREYIGKNNEDYNEFDYFFEKARKEVEKDD